MGFVQRRVKQIIEDCDGNALWGACQLPRALALADISHKPSPLRCWVGLNESKDGWCSAGAALIELRICLVDMVPTFKFLLPPWARDLSEKEAISEQLGLMSYDPVFQIT